MANYSRSLQNPCFGNNAPTNPGGPSYSEIQSVAFSLPHFKALANAPLVEVLRMWQGLGYNRRALFLHQTAQIITKNNSRFPKTIEEVTDLPGIGPYTAGAILTFAYNIPSVFIETNIRSVFIHFFFSGDSSTKKIHDRDIMPLIEKTLDSTNPREWYFALMDYGTFLKSKNSNPSRRSFHHIKQSPFKGSHRQLRALILKIITNAPSGIKLSSIKKTVPISTTTKEIGVVLNELVTEGFVETTVKVLYRFPLIG